jgi:hypothetical protein
VLRTQISLIWATVVMNASGVIAAQIGGSVRRAVVITDRAA